MSYRNKQFAVFFVNLLKLPIMIKTIPAAERHFVDYGWLQTYWLFSFSDYYDPENTQFGPLRVFNDDIVQPQSGFPTHPHREMEIISIIMQGEISHKDSAGNEAIIQEGEVQRMSAGKGIMHSEYNMGDEPLHLYQIWILPDVVGLDPSYDQKRFDPSLWKNKLAPVASGQGFEDIVSFHTDATIYRCELEQDKEITFPCEKYRKLFIYLSSGNISINNNLMEPRDQARISDEQEIQIISHNHADFLLIDLAG